MGWPTLPILPLDPHLVFTCVALTITRVSNIETLLWFSSLQWEQLPCGNAVEEPEETRPHIPFSSTHLPLLQPVAAQIRDSPLLV